MPCENKISAVSAAKSYWRKIKQSRKWNTIHHFTYQFVKPIFYRVDLSIWSWWTILLNQRQKLYPIFMAGFSSKWKKLYCSFSS